MMAAMMAEILLLILIVFILTPLMPIIIYFWVNLFEGMFGRGGGDDEDNGTDSHTDL